MKKLNKKDILTSVVYEIEINKNVYCIDEVVKKLNISNETLYKNNNFEIISNLIMVAKIEYISNFLYKIRFNQDKNYYINELIKFRVNLNNFKISFGKFDLRGNYRFNNVPTNIYSIYDGYANSIELLSTVCAFNKGCEFCREMK